MRRWLSAPPLHFVLGGLLLFLVVELRGRSAEGEKPQLVVPAARVLMARQELEASLRRGLTAEEREQALETAIDDELLFRFALDLGLDREPEIAGRLAQIARFVDADEAPASQAQIAPASQTMETLATAWADEAKRLGLHRGDPVVRNLLIDRARRLIRAAVLLREPSEQALEDYWREHGARFREPERVELDVVVLGRGVSAQDAAARAEALRRRDGAGWPEHSVEHWPALEAREVERRLGPVASEVSRLETGAWASLRGRDGALLVRVRGREPARTAPLDTVRPAVRAEVRQMLAERWLAARLELLRADYEVVIEELDRPRGSLS